ncbi:CD83 antigen [Lampris incognitus]|uniref:CD83 antigen n=1 Tax=Lampris incognitus TaxID=2546036 RepID=UPI0024B5632B|nr:CD83 antigen [Lampris incognitus]
MLTNLLRPSLLFVLCVCEIWCSPRSLEGTRSECGGDGILRCTAPHKAGIRYRHVRWYKVIQDSSSHLNGLLMRYLPNGTINLYVDSKRHVELLGDSMDLFLPNVTSEDSGTYMCLLAAPVGEQNQEGSINLTVEGCPDSKSVSKLVVFAIGLLAVALLIFMINYAIMTKKLHEKNGLMKKETSSGASLKPLVKKNLMLIYTLGQNGCSPASMKHVCV